MTSEVVVMNRLGVALATDSAATVYVGGRAKVYHADKLFMLSHKHPVGAMVYNNSSLLGVPWETILKLFRKELGAKSFPTLVEYGERLLGYLNGATHLFPQQVQDTYYLNLVETLYMGIEERIQERIKEEILAAPGDGKDDGEQARQVAAEVIQEELAEWRAKNDAVGFAPIGVDLAGRMSPEVASLSKAVFGHRKLGGPESQALHELASLVVAKDEILHESRTGLVIAGFGEDEHLPVMKSYELGEVFGGQLKYRELAPKKIDGRTPSVVEAFAEREVVASYLDGISPDFEIKVLEDVAELLLGIPEAVVDSLVAMPDAEKELLKAKIGKGSLRLLQEWMDELETYRRDRNAPFLQSIAFLPKNELAHVAASLVSLTSFQKRMSIQEDETVGGPIDVAVISKCDGFVWIERKHYFRPELNRHFFNNYGIQPDPNRTGPHAQEAKRDETGD